MEIIPGNGKVVIKVLPVKSRGILEVPASQKDRPTMAMILRIAEGEEYFFEVGDTVVFNRHAGIEIGEFKLIDYHDIYAKIEEDEK